MGKDATHWKESEEMKTLADSLGEPTRSVFDPPEVVPGLPYEQYDSAVIEDGDELRTFVRSTVLKLMQRSPAHARHELLWPRKSTPALDRGIGQHLLLFEPDKFDSEFIVAPTINKTTKAGKAAWAELEDAAEGRTILRPTTKGDPGAKLDGVRAMAEAARKHPTFGAMLENGRPELSVFAVVNGVPCKCRVDWLCQYDSWTTVLNYKTTSKSADWGPFRRDIRNYGYDFAEAFYRKVLDKAVPGPPRKHVFAVQETFPPYAMAFYELDDEWMEGASDEVDRALSLWQACERSGEWPGYEESIQPMAAPDWLADKFAAEVDR